MMSWSPLLLKNLQKENQLINNEDKVVTIMPEIPIYNLRKIITFPILISYAIVFGLIISYSYYYCKIILIILRLIFFGIDLLIMVQANNLFKTRVNLFPKDIKSDLREVYLQAISDYFNSYYASWIIFFILFNSKIFNII